MSELGESKKDSFQPVYDLDLVGVSHLSLELLSKQAEHVPEKYRFVTLEIDGDDRSANIGRFIERTVFEESFENDADEMEKEYGPYEDASKFFVSFDRSTQMPTGALRVIKHSQNGFKTFNDIQSEPFFVDEESAIHRHSIKDVSKIWDIGTVAVLPEYRKAEGPVSVQLYRAMYLSALHNNIEHFVSVIDDIPLKKLTGYLGIPFIPLADSEPGMYLGSDKSQPVYGYVPEFYEKMNRHRFTPKGLLARKALNRLVRGSEDDSIVFKDTRQL
jgi:hypothetical protein